VTASGLVRTGALLGVAGGVLRAAGSFAPTLIASNDARVWLYAVTDVCLTAGLLSVYASRRHHLRAAGSSGLFLALVGFIANWIVPAITHADVYPITAAAIAIGVVMLSLSQWQAGKMAAWIPAAFVLSVVLGGVGMFVAGAGALFVVSGILFGGAFAGMAATHAMIT
jgi:hypothetical protein